MAAFVVLLVAVWGLGFMWVRGDLNPSTDEVSASKADPSKSASPSASASADASPSPSDQISVKPSAEPDAKPTRKTDKLAELKAVVVNPVVPRPKPRVLPPVATFTMASFNVLGSSHTGGRGHHPRLASGPRRMGGVLALFSAHNISVVGIQEFQPNQRGAFQSRARGWSMYPGLSMGGRAGENSVAWRDDTWEMVKPGLIPIPYFNGRIRPMPYVLLRHKATGVQAYFSTFHNPANIGGNMQRFRNEATRREVGLFNRLEGTGIPQFVTGDMNERAEYFCRVTGSTPLVAAAGGSNSGGCNPPRPSQIDWIFGSPGAQFSEFQVDRSPLVRRTSDHPIMVTKVSIDAAKFPNSYKPSGG